jgi:hypothetical protein
LSMKMAISVLQVYLFWTLLLVFLEGKEEEKM